MCIYSKCRFIKTNKIKGDKPAKQQPIKSTPLKANEPKLSDFRFEKDYVSFCKIAQNETYAFENQEYLKNEGFSITFFLGSVGFSLSNSKSSNCGSLYGFGIS